MKSTTRATTGRDRTNSGLRLLGVLMLGLASIIGRADISQPMIRYAMDSITADGKVLNSGTNTDSRCDLTLGPALYVTNILSRKCLFFNPSRNTYSYAWAPGLRTRSVSFWMFRPVDDSNVNTNELPELIAMHRAQYILSGLSRQNIMVNSGSADVTVRIGVSETETQRTYYYYACPPSRGRWHHVVFTFEDTGLTDPEDGDRPIYNFKSYLDGQIYKDVSGRRVEEHYDVAGTFRIGSNVVNGDRPINGALADFCIYDCVLTPAEVYECYRANYDAMPSELIAWYPMEQIDESEGAHSTPDRSGNSFAKALSLGSAVAQVSGAEGNGLRFNATGPSWAYTQPQTGGCPIYDFTVTLWMNLPRNLEELCGEQSRHMPRIWLWYNATRLMLNTTSEFPPDARNLDLFLFGDSATWRPNPCYLGKGGWSHVAVVSEVRADYSSATIAYSSRPRIYVNGELVYAPDDFSSCGIARIPDNSNFYVGNLDASNTGARGIYGDFDDLRIYRGALSAEEIRAVYGGVPMPDAGVDFTTAASVTELHGNVPATIDDPYPRACRIDSVNWSLVSAPVGGEAASIESPASLNTRVTLPVAGDYVFRLAATSAQATRTNDVTVTRVASPMVNVAPMATASAAVAGEVFAAVPIAATVADSDGPGTLRGRWRLVSGPGGVWFDDPYAPSTQAMFSAPGTYTIRYVVSDGLDSASVDIACTINGSAEFAAEVSSITNGLMGYWSFSDPKLRDSVTGVSGSRDTTHTTQSGGRDGAGYRGYGLSSSFISNVSLQENGTVGNRARPEANGEVWRTFSFWMYHDAANPGTNVCKMAALLHVPYTLALCYTPEGPTLFYMYCQSLNKDEDGNTITGGGGGYYFNSPAVSPSNRWTHVYVAFDRYRPAASNGTQLWIDGVRQTPASGTYGFGRVRSNPITFGGVNADNVSTVGNNGYFKDENNNVLSRAFPGWMDEIRMYNRLLSEDEIKYLARRPMLEANRGPSVSALAETEPKRILRKKPFAFSPTAAGEPMPYDVTLTYAWEIVAGDATKVTIADATVRSTSVTFARAGTYVLRLAVSDGARTTYSDPLTVEVPVAGATISFR